MLTFSRYLHRLYLTSIVVATLSACTTMPPSAPEREPGISAPRSKPGAEAQVPSVRGEPERDTARAREELLKYEEAVKLFREENRPMEAIEMLDGFLKMHPDSIYVDDALFEQARIWKSEGEPRKAVSILKKLLHDHPSSHLRKAANLELERIYYDSEKWRDCIEAADNVLSFDTLPDERVEALTMKAICLSNRRDREEAVADAIEATRLGASEEVTLKAEGALELIAGQLKDREFKAVMSRSDGSKPYALIAMVGIEKDIEGGLETEAMSALMDLMVQYPGLIPDERIQKAYASLRDRLLVQTNVIGAVLPLTGDYAFYGQKALQGIQAALGFLAEPGDSTPPTEFSLAVADSGADPARAAQAVRELSDSDQVIAIIGPMFSRTTRAAAEAAQETGTPIISLSPDPEIPSLGKNVFRRGLLDQQQISALVSLVSDRLKMTRFAFLYPDSPYGNEMMNQFWDEIDRRGGEVVAAESFPPGQTDFGPQIRAMVGLDRKPTPEEVALKDSDGDHELQPIVDFDALFIPADFQTVGLLAPQLAFYDVNEVLLMGSDGWNSPWLVELGEHYVEGALFTGGYLQDIDDPAVRELTERYWLTFGEDPQPLAVQAYDAARIIRSGVESGLARDRASLREYLMNLENFQSAEGPLTTDENGDIRQRPLLLTVDNGKIKRFEIEFD